MKMANRKGNEKDISVRNQFLMAILASMPSFFYGLLAGWLLSATPQLQSPEGPSSVPFSDFQISAIGGSMTFGAMFGAVVYTCMMEKFGRKIALFCLSTPFAIGWMMKICSSEFYVLLAARFVAGMPCGGSFVIIPLYINEISHSSCRGILGTIFTIAHTVGYIMSYALGGYSNYYANLYIYLVLPLLHMLLSFFYGLESPSFLIKKGRCEDATKAIAWLNGLESTDEKVISGIDEIKAEHKKAASSPKISFKSLFKNPSTFETLKLCFGLMVLHSLSGAFVIMSYTPLIYQRAGVGLDPNAQAVITGCTQLIGCLLTFALIDKAGRKVILKAACVMALLAYALLSIWFFLLDYAMIELPGWIILMAVTVCNFTFGLGSNPLPFVIIFEVLDLKLRATLSGCLMVYCWFHNSMMLLSIDSLSKPLGMGSVFMTFSSVSQLGLLLAIFNLPETKGKSVENIQKELLERKKKPTLPCCRK